MTKNKKSPGSMSAKQHRRSVFNRIRKGVLGIVAAPDSIMGKMATHEPGKDPFKPLTMLGSGFLVDPVGIAVTAKHVIQPFQDAFEAFQAGKGPQPPMLKFLIPSEVQTRGNEYSWTLRVGLVPEFFTSKSLDLAVLRLPPHPDHPYASLPLSRQLCEEGDEIAICGYPFGLHLHKDQYGGIVTTPSFSSGIVSAVLPFANAPAITRLVFQVDAMVNGGNSGGPAFDPATAEVYGVVASAMTTEYTIKGVAPVDGSVTETDPEKGSKVKIKVPAGLARVIPIHHVSPMVAELNSRMAQAGPPAAP